MNELSADHADRGFFRCAVKEEDSKAMLYVGRRKIPAKLQDKSIDGFAVVVEPRYVRKLQVGPQWILKTNGEVTEVWAQWMFNAADGHVQVGLRRLRDLTPQSDGPWFPTIFSYRKHTSNPELLMAALVLVSILALSLPGVGDRLGTSGRIQRGAQLLCEVIREGVAEIW